MASVASSVDVTDVMDGQKTGVFHVRIVVLCALMLFLDGIDNQGINVCVQPYLAILQHMRSYLEHGPAAGGKNPV